MYSVEWQKRGLPHAHILLWLQTKIQPGQIDSIISAEIPNSQQDPLLYEIVCRNMIHGPCGEINKNSPCMINGKCSKNYPREFMTETQTGADGFPKYRRRSTLLGGHVAVLKTHGRVEVDNRWIVPYSPMLSRCFSAHINIEYCHSIKAIKYVCKYINKGSDQASATVEFNEIDLYLNGRYISSAEAAWRILEFRIHERFPAVVHLSVHLENGQRVYFNPSNITQRLESPPKTTLMAFFDLCASDEFARTLLYSDVPSYYTWTNNKFQRRKRGEEVPGHPEIKKDSAIGRVYTIHPSLTECFYLRMLLHYVKGPVSFLALRTVNGCILPTYQEACRELGLLESDEQWSLTLKEAVITQSPFHIRELFVIILIFCQPSNPLSLWNEFKESMCEDILYEERQLNQNPEIAFSEQIFNKGLILLQSKITTLSEKCLDDFNLPVPVISNSSDTSHNYNPIDLQNYVSMNESKLNGDQRYAYDTIIDSVFNNKGKLLFIDAPGGTGKTFLINLLLAKVRAAKMVAVGVASSGIAATLMSGGKTAHSTFKLPLKIVPEEDTVCPIRKNGTLAKMLKEAVVVFWDECTMSHRAHLEAVNRTLQDIRSSSKVMGGLTFVLCGDFRQTLPVIPRGTRANVVGACLKSSFLWSKVERLSLTINMRTVLSGDQDDLTFAERLLEIGAGNSGSNIAISNDIGIRVQNLNELINSVYPDIKNLMSKGFEYLCERAIITPKNSSVDEINEIILQKFTAESTTFRSIDSVVNTDDAVNFPLEFLQSLNPPGVPSHMLFIKIGSPIILLRNLDPPKLCNGTRLRVMGFKRNIIEIKILTGPSAGENAIIPRIPIIPSDYPFQFKRLQFPVKNCFAMTINKAQGQTFKCVGIDLREECFSHGQLYVALSRVGRRDAQHILLSANERTPNIVYPEVLN